MHDTNGLFWHMYAKCLSTWFFFKEEPHELHANTTIFDRVNVNTKYFLSNVEEGANTLRTLT